MRHSRSRASGGSAPAAKRLPCQGCGASHQSTARAIACVARDAVAANQSYELASVAVSVLPLVSRNSGPEDAAPCECCGLWHRSVARAQACVAKAAAAAARSNQLTSAAAAARSQQLASAAAAVQPLPSAAAVQPLPFPAQPSNSGGFVTELSNIKLMHCSCCGEAEFGHSIVTGARLQHFVTVAKCLKCAAPRSKHYLKFQKTNGLHLSPPPSYLPKLTDIEESLISLNSPVLRFFRLRGGSWGYGGSCVSITQAVDQVATQLPRLISSLDLVIVTKHIASDTGNSISKNFRVRKGAVLAWLTFLKASNPLYADIEVGDAVDLPEDSGRSLDHLRCHVREEPHQILDEAINQDGISHSVVDGWGGNVALETTVLRENIMKRCHQRVWYSKHSGKMFSSCFPVWSWRPDVSVPHNWRNFVRRNQSFAKICDSFWQHFTLSFCRTPCGTILCPRRSGYISHTHTPTHTNHNCHTHIPLQLRQALLGQSSIFLKQRNADFPTTKTECMFISFSSFLLIHVAYSPSMRRCSVAAACRSGCIHCSAQIH